MSSSAEMGRGKEVIQGMHREVREHPSRYAATVIFAFTVIGAAAILVFPEVSEAPYLVAGMGAGIIGAHVVRRSPRSKP